ATSSLMEWGRSVSLPAALVLIEPAAKLSHEPIPGRGYAFRSLVAVARRRRAARNRRGIVGGRRGHLRHSGGGPFQQAKARENRRILPQRNRGRKDSRRYPVDPAARQAGLSRVLRGARHRDQSADDG